MNRPGFVLIHKALLKFVKLLGVSSVLPEPPFLYERATANRFTFCTNPGSA